jgi:predicted transposase YdaD
MLGMQLQETRVYREAKEEGREEGRKEGQQQEAVNLLLRLLRRRCGNLSDELTQRISNLPLSVLEDLSEALLDFSSLDDLLAWLEAH